MRSWAERRAWRKAGRGVERDNARGFKRDRIQFCEPDPEVKRWRHRWRHSLRSRLITVFLLLALAVTAVFLAGMQRAFYGGWSEVARPLVSDYVGRLVADIGAPPDIARAQSLVARLPISVRISGPVVNWDSHPDGPRRGWRSEPRADGDPERWFDRGRPGPRAGEVLTRTTSDGHRISFGLGDLPWQHAPEGVGWLTLGLLLLLTAIAYGYVRRLLRPLDDIRAGAERFGGGRFDKPIPLRRRDELGDLARRINTMAHDIEGMLDAKRALLLALSHELRSPLTRARLNAELLPVTGEGSVERDALMRDLGEMRDLISDLLESERLASPHAALQREAVDVAALVRDTVNEMGHADAIALDLAADLPAMQLDRTRIKLLVRNLVDNALRYGAGQSRPPSVTVRRSLERGGGGDGEGVVIAVRDFGPGVDEAQLAHLTEPFYRTDSARQRATGGVGLGMYLCRLVAQAHGGRLTVSNAHTGLLVEVALA